MKSFAVSTIYGETLVEPGNPVAGQCSLPASSGNDGKAKMSKSLGNCIYLSEEPEEIQKKIMRVCIPIRDISVYKIRKEKIEGNHRFYSPVMPSASPNISNAIYRLSESGRTDSNIINAADWAT